MKDNLELYKEFYFREIDRKNELNNIINIPILIITGIISIQLYFYSQKIENCILIYLQILTFLSISSIIYSTYFLLKSFSNFFKNHTYKELDQMKVIYKYEKDLIEEQKKKKVAAQLFSDYLKEEFSECSSHNFIINKIRTEDIAKSKKGIFISVICTILFSITILTSIFIMAKKTTPKQDPKPITTIQKPTSVLIKNSKQTKDESKTKKGN